MKKLILLLFVIFLVIPLAFAHEYETGEGKQEKTLSHQIQDNSMLSTLAGAGFLALITIYMLATNKQKFFKKQKTILFILIILPAVLVTSYLVYSTLYLNSISHTEGPIHWHADYEIWNCNEQLELINPQGFSNKIGNNVFHEHNDNRIHVEGVVVNPQDVSLKEFFEVTAGELSLEHLTMNTNKGVITIQNTQLCNNQPSILQVFVWKTKGNTAYQEKIENFPEYVLSPESYIPPGDCIIIEFTGEKSQTDKLCQTYETALQKGELFVDAGDNKNLSWLHRVDKGNGGSPYNGS